MNTNNMEDIVEKYSDMILRIAYQNLKNKTGAEDILQEVFVKLISVKNRPLEEEHLKAWLIRVTVNLCKNYWKAAWIRKTVPLEENWLQISENNITLWEELWSLPAKYRNTLYLYYYEGYTVPEISVILQIPLNTAYTHLQRAKEKLKVIILEEEESDE
ncbi:MAG: RNA polymerase sigma factor [Acutalibacteraceae bacterium]